MQHPSKWRETIDPYTLPFKNFELLEILGYPHAGNDVFSVSGNYKGSNVYAFLKVERQLGADIEREHEMITQLNHPIIPTILDYSLVHPRFILTKAMEGQRLSMIVGSNENLESLSYLREYGKILASFHRLPLEVPPVKPRKFFNIPDQSFFIKHKFPQVLNYLIASQPNSPETCFVHGDFHYANLLWQDGHLSAILDFELSGIGIKEFDLAWALIVRPGQKFLKTQLEINEFLSGYKELLSYNVEHLIYYMMQIYCYFYEIGKHSKDEAYCAFIKNFFLHITSGGTLI